jgi:hypothetical protein
MSLIDRYHSSKGSTELGKKGDRKPIQDLSVKETQMSNLEENPYSNKI